MSSNNSIKMGKVNCIWKGNGVQDKFLQKLIAAKKVNKNTTPSNLKKEYPHIFNNFSTAVVRNHLNELRRRHGLYRKLKTILLNVFTQIKTHLLVKN